MLAVVLYHKLKQTGSRCAMRGNMVLSVIGMFLSGYFAVPEMLGLLRGEVNYMLGLPTCAYGLFFYIVIFVVSLVSYVKIQKKPEAELEPPPQQEPTFGA